MKITIQELSKSFGGRDIFNNFSLEVDSGVRLCVCGPNGTGKSTLLRLLAGVEPADGGRVILPRGCRLGFVGDVDVKVPEGQVFALCNARGESLCEFDPGREIKTAFLALDGLESGASYALMTGTAGSMQQTGTVTLP